MSEKEVSTQKKVEVENSFYNKTKQDLFQETRDLLSEYSKIVTNGDYSQETELYECMYNILQRLLFFPEYLDQERLFMIYNAIKILESSSISKDNNSSLMEDKNLQAFFLEELMEYFGTDITIEQMTEKEKEKIRKGIKHNIKGMYFIPRRSLLFSPIIFSQDNFTDRIIEGKIGKEKFILVRSENSGNRDNDLSERLEIYTEDKIYSIDKMNTSTLKYEQIDHDDGVGQEYLLVIRMPLKPDERQSVYLSKPKEKEDSFNYEGNDGSCEITLFDGYYHTSYSFGSVDDIFDLEKPIPEIEKKYQGLFFDSANKSYKDKDGNKHIIIPQRPNLDEKRFIPAIKDGIINVIPREILELIRTVDPQLAYMIQFKGKNPTVSDMMQNFNNTQVVDANGFSNAMEYMINSGEPERRNLVTRYLNKLDCTKKYIESVNKIEERLSGSQLHSLPYYFAFYDSLNFRGKDDEKNCIIHETHEMYTKILNQMSADNVCVICGKHVVDDIIKKQIETGNLMLFQRLCGEKQGLYFTKDGINVLRLRDLESKQSLRSGVLEHSSEDERNSI